MTRPVVLVFAGLDPSGGAGISADIEAISGQGAHPLPLVTALTVQDNNRVHGVQAVDASLLARQAQLLCDAFAIRAVKTGIPGSRANAQVIADVVANLRRAHPGLPLVVDPVLRSGGGDSLGEGDPAADLAPLLEVATLALPNTLEEERLALAQVPHVMVTGGHATRAQVINAYRGPGASRTWTWPRLPGEFHGSGCTLAAAAAAWLAHGVDMETALDQAQHYTFRTLSESYTIGPGQRIPLRRV